MITDAFRRTRRGFYMCQRSDARVSGLREMVACVRETRERNRRTVVGRTTNTSICVPFKYAEPGRVGCVFVCEP